jgi:hypothetical protein
VSEPAQTVTEQVITAEQAKELTERIRATLADAWKLILEAWECNAWYVLGYKNWDAYCVAEFGVARLRIPLAERRAAVGSMREAGMSLRVIGVSLGYDDSTVRRDIQALTDAGETNLPATVTGTNGRTYEATNGRKGPRGGVREYDRARPTAVILEEQLDQLVKLCKTVRYKLGGECLAEVHRVVIADQIRELKPDLDWLEGLLTDNRKKARDDG